MLSNVQDVFLRNIVIYENDKVAVNVQLLINSISEELDVKISNSDYMKIMKEVGFPKIKTLKMLKNRVDYYTDHSVQNLPNAVRDLVESALSTFNSIEDYIYMIKEEDEFND